MNWIALLAFAIQKRCRFHVHIHPFSLLRVVRCTYLSMNMIRNKIVWNLFSLSILRMTRSQLNGQQTYTQEFVAHTHAHSQPIHIRVAIVRPTLYWRCKKIKQKCHVAAIIVCLSFHISTTETKQRIFRFEKDFGHIHSFYDTSNTIWPSFLVGHRLAAGNKSKPE